MELKQDFVRTAIANWKEAAEKDVNAIIKGFEKGNCFYFDRPKDLPERGVVHIYPGLMDTQIYFFVIPQEYDNAAYADSWEKYMQGYEVTWNLAGNRIPEEEARTRVVFWDEGHEEWLPAAQKAGGIFLVFTIENIDFEVEKSIVNMALRKDVNFETDFVADMIVTNVDNTAVYYDDFGKPCPPICNASAMQGYYLLSL